MLFFTNAGLVALRVMMSDRGLANPEKFAHVRREFGIDAPDPG
jgi:ribosomal protein L29